MKESLDNEDDSNEGGTPKKIRTIRDRSQSLDNLNQGRDKKRSKVDKVGQVLGEPEVGVAKHDSTLPVSILPVSILPNSILHVSMLEDFNISKPGNFCDLYKSSKNGLLYKFIRKSGRPDDIIYLAGDNDNCLYEYNTQTSDIKEHQLSKFHEKTTIFSGDYVKLAQRLLLGDSNPKKREEREIVNVNIEGLSTISESLTTCVDVLLKDMRRRDNKKIKLGENSKFGRILRRAVLAILSKYGLEIDYVAAVQNDIRARDRLHRVNLRHSTEKWEENMGKDNLGTAKLSATWLMSNNDGMKDEIKSLKENYHKESSISAITEAYVSAICNDKTNKALAESLAEVRLRWAPITYGSEIHLDVLKSTISETDEWYYFNTLIHEALHSVEHPNFTLFLDTQIPFAIQESVKEGIVDYLTSKIWIDIVGDLTPEKGGKKSDRITPSHQNLNEPLQINQKSKDTYHDNYVEYKTPVAVVKNLISRLDAGDEKLITAYFGGNLGAFLPKLMDTDEEMI